MGMYGWHRKVQAVLVCRSSTHTRMQIHARTRLIRQTHTHTPLEALPAAGVCGWHMKVQAVLDLGHL